MDRYNEYSRSQQFTIGLLLVGGSLSLDRY